MERIFWKISKHRRPKELIKTGNKEISETKEFTIEDVKKATRNLKNNKAARTDGMHSELIQYRAYKLLNSFMD
jgi:hypothetical protein